MPVEPRRSIRNRKNVQESERMHAEVETEQARRTEPRRSIRNRKNVQESERMHAEVETEQASKKQKDKEEVKKNEHEDAHITYEGDVGEYTVGSGKRSNKESEPEAKKKASSAKSRSPQQYMDDTMDEDEDEELTSQISNVDTQQSREKPHSSNVQQRPSPRLHHTPYVDTFSSDDDDEDINKVTKKPASRSKTATSHLYSFILIFVSFMVGFATGILTAPYFRSELNAILGEPPGSSKTSKQTLLGSSLNEKITDLQKKFSSQDEKFWRVVKSTLNGPLYNDDPKKPGILLIASSENGRNTSRCIAEYVLQMSDEIIKGKHIQKDLSVFANVTDSEDAKSELLIYLENGFKQEAKGVLLSGLQYLSGNAAMALKGYTDNENALVKKAVIVTTLETLDSVKDLEPSDWDQVVVDKLIGMWGTDLGGSKASALSSRVANNIVAANPETYETLKSANCY